MSKNRFRRKAMHAKAAQVLQHSGVVEPSVHLASFDEQTGEWSAELRTTNWPEVLRATGKLRGKKTPGLLSMAIAEGLLAVYRPVETALLVARRLRGDPGLGRIIPPLDPEQARNLAANIEYALHREMGSGTVTVESGEPTVNGTPTVVFRARHGDGAEAFHVARYNELFRGDGRTQEGRPHVVVSALAHDLRVALGISPIFHAQVMHTQAGPHLVLHGNPVISVSAGNLGAVSGPKFVSKRP